MSEPSTVSINEADATLDKATESYAEALADWVMLYLERHSRLRHNAQGSEGHDNMVRAIRECMG